MSETKMKRKRGSNYTKEEKAMLLDIVEKYPTIESKRTDAAIIMKKQNAWVEVCREYNAVATSGVRHWKQLRHLYENLKSNMKKSVADVNKSNFMKQLTTEQDVEQNNIALVKKKATDDKKEIFRTGGGCYKTTLSENDNKLLAMVAKQVIPLENPFDDAAVYFSDAVDIAEVEVTESNSVSEEVEVPSNVLAEVPESYFGMLQDSPAVEDGLKQNSSASQDGTSATTGKNFKTTAKSKKGTIDYKKMYFKIKYENAKLERKDILKKMRIHDLKLQLLKKRLQIRK